MCPLFQTELSPLENSSIHWLMMRTFLAAYLFIAMPLACNGQKNSSDSVAAAVSTKEALCLVETPDEPPPAAEPAAECPADPVFGGRQMRTEIITFVGVAPHKKILAEVAVSERERTRGLMYRTKLSDGHGMLFVEKGSARIQSFWMRNTCIPLDMLFIDKEGRIAGILENVPPMNEQRRSIPCPVNYVLEVPAGWCRKNDIKAGQRVVLPDRL